MHQSLEALQLPALKFHRKSVKSALPPEPQLWARSISDQSTQSLTKKEKGFNSRDRTKAGGEDIDTGTTPVHKTPAVTAMSRYTSEVNPSLPASSRDSDS